VKLLITGAGGQLGHELVRLGGHHALLAPGYDALDITDPDALLACVTAFAPDAVINAAAYTAVDRAESDESTAFSVNCDGPANLARICQEHGMPLIHISTDYVFDGSKQGAYLEEDATEPLGVYGRSKLAGEQAVLRICPQSIILRTSWLFSAYGQNFVKSMIRLGSACEKADVVADQHGCPTSGTELARAIYAVLDSGVNDDCRGIYNFCQPEPTTWFAFAGAVFETAADQGMLLNIKQVDPITTAEYPTAAQRPANSVMDCSKFRQTFAFAIKPWRESLVDVVHALAAQR